MGYTPILTSPAGLCLTEANWAAAGISSASFYLSALLMKPGYDCLMALPDLASYVGWKQRLILNASLPKKRSSDQYTVRSIYDGRSMSYSCDEISALITKLKPDVVVLPEGIGSSVTTARSVFRPVQEVPFETEGVYFSYDKKISTTEFLEKISQHHDKPRYVAGDLSLNLMTTLISMGVDIVESDRPAMDACLGMVYTAEGELSIQDASQTMQFEPIDSACACPTCSAGFTRAYLHHLFEHTPLLCQRLLVQHNAYVSILMRLPCQKNINHLRMLKIPI